MSVITQVTLELVNCIIDQRARLFFVRAPPADQDGNLEYKSYLFSIYSAWLFLLK